MEFPRDTTRYSDPQYQEYLELVEKAEALRMQALDLAVELGLLPVEYATPGCDE